MMKLNIGVKGRATAHPDNKKWVKKIGAVKIGIAVIGAALLSPLLAYADDLKITDRRLGSFERIATFPVFQNSDVDLETVAEIVTASQDGNTLIYTDSETENIGFVDITDPANPQPKGLAAVGGEPTSVSVVGQYAIVGVNTSESFMAPSGKLVVVDIATQQIVSETELGGQPDAVAVSPDQRYAAIAIENERDEDLGDGEPPQAPAGFLSIIDLVGAPADWTVREVSLTGLADLFPEDPEPEYVAINARNQAVVTLQENNHIVLVDLATGTVKADFSAGTVDLKKIDTVENDLIELNTELADVPREPDGVTWLSNKLFATADEGDLFGGSRGFTIFNKSGKVLFTSGNSNDLLTARLGHYPEGRSENKGNEPENVAFARFGNKNHLFVGSERANVVFVYEIKGDLKNRAVPILKQVLPTGVGPEGLLPIPNRNLFIAASEKDERGDKFRSVLTIYQRTPGWKSEYPTVISANRRGTSTPIPWGALSGLAVNPITSKVGYAVHDSFYQSSRIYRMILGSPAAIVGEIILKDQEGRLAVVDDALVNDDGTVNLDLEGVATRRLGEFWVVSEGAGTVGSDSRPFESLNLLLKVNHLGEIKSVVTLPESTNARQVRFGFEGVAVTGYAGSEKVYVAFQREWADDPDDRVRIGEYSVSDRTWRYFYYPLEQPQSENGGWVGLSEIIALKGDRFAVVERDNQGGTDAVIKRIYQFSIADLAPIEDSVVGTTPTFPVVEKELVRDLVPDILARGGAVLEKIEGLAVTRRGDAIFVNDNDGVDDSNGETQLIKIKKLFKKDR